MIEDLGKLQNDELGAIVDQMFHRLVANLVASNTAVAQSDTYYPPI